MGDKLDLIDGEEIFQLMDTYGLPLEIIVLELRRKGLGFNVPQFIKAAKDSNNFTFDGIKQRLLSCLPQEHHENVEKELLKLGGKG